MSNDQQQQQNTADSQDVINILINTRNQQSDQILILTAENTSLKRQLQEALKQDGDEVPEQQH
jgi:hypothetical protein